MRRVMCAPTYFDVEYTINPWMKPQNRVDRELAQKQWDNLVELLTALGDSIDFVEPQPGLLDMTFAGDAGLVWEKTFIPSNFRHPERRPEPDYFVPWFEANEFEVRRIPTEIVFEGLGDVVFHGRRAFCGHGRRSDPRAIPELRKLLPELDVIANLELVDDRYFHLAMALGFVDEEIVVYYPPAFTEESCAAITTNIPNAIAMEARDANEYFACNNLVVGPQILMDGCTDALRLTLGEAGYEVVTCDMSEFKKSGGSLRCLVLTMI